MPGSFDILLVAQSGRTGYEALLCVASLRAFAPEFAGRIFVAEPQPGPLWPQDPRMAPHLRAPFSDLGALPLPFDSRHFGATYPIGNKIEALCALPGDRPVLFLDSDMLVLAPLHDAGIVPDRPAASRKVRDTWPNPPLYGPSRGTIWQCLFDRFGLDIEPTRDHRFSQQHWRHYLYRNAGWIYAPNGATFGTRFAEIATDLWHTPPTELACQPLDPWLDQVALPLTLASFGGTQHGPDLDDGPLWHYRSLAHLFATAPDRIIAQVTALTRANRLKKHLKQHRPFHRALYRGEGEAARAMFDRSRLPASDAIIRNRLRRAGLWAR